MSLADFYVTLFSSVALVGSDLDFFVDSIHHRLSGPDRESCEDLITEEECRRALRTFKHQKSAGIDGLPYEFYQQFWGLLGNDLVAAFNECFQLGQLSFSQLTGVHLAPL